MFQLKTGRDIRYTRSFASVLIWPYSLREQVLFGLTLMTALTLLVVGSGFEAPLVVIGPAYMGMHAVAFMTSPASVFVGHLRPDHVRLCLSRLGYRREPDPRQEVWLPPLPKWLIWSNSGVGLGKSGNGLTLHGPYLVLDVLLNNLKAHGYVE
jgi:hypothetical protein